jgi:hypothetical protein
MKKKKENNKKKTNVKQKMSLEKKLTAIEQAKTRNQPPA